jgi:hypothetical protein
MSIKVTFCIDCYSNDNKLARRLTEDELDLNFWRYSAYLAKEDEIHGDIIIEVPGYEELHIVDELYNSIAGVCFLSMSNLAAGRAYTYTYFECSVKLRLVMHRGYLKCFGEDVPYLEASASELLPALYHCGERYLNTLLRVPGYTHKSSAIQGLEQCAEIARRALTINQVSLFNPTSNPSSLSSSSKLSKSEDNGQPAIGKFLSTVKGRTSYEVQAAEDATAFKFAEVISARFDFAKTTEVLGFEQMFMDFKRGNLAISVGWDTWSGAYVRALTKQSDKIVVEIGAYLNMMLATL